VYLPTGYGHVPAVFTEEAWEEIFDTYKNECIVDIGGDDTVSSVSYISLDLHEVVSSAVPVHVSDEDHLDICRDLSNGNSDFMENLCFFTLGAHGLKKRMEFFDQVISFAKSHNIVLSDTTYTGIGEASVELIVRDFPINITIKIDENHEVVTIVGQQTTVKFDTKEKNFAEELEKIVGEVPDIAIVSDEEVDDVTSHSFPPQDDTENFADFDAALSADITDSK
jgi:hypothetical protein